MTATTVLRTGRRRHGGMQDLLGRRGGPESEATAVNTAGVVVGTACGRAFRWEAGRLTDLGPDQGGSEARAIDALGVVAGCSWTLADRPAATLWNAQGLERLPAAPDEQASVANGIVGDGLVVGSSRAAATGRWRAVVWSGTDVRLLADLGGDRSEALAVSADGLVVGSSSTAEGETRAVCWEDGRPRDLGTLGGSRSAARAVNALGHVAGWSTTADGHIHAVLWADGRAIDLGTLGGARSEANGLSDRGQVVGWSTRPGSEEKRAFSWYQGELSDLGTLRGTNSVARAVNDTGWVVGRASTGAGALSVPIRSGAWSWEAHAVLVRTAA